MGNSLQLKKELFIDIFNQDKDYSNVNDYNGLIQIFSQQFPKDQQFQNNLKLKIKEQLQINNEKIKNLLDALLKMISDEENQILQFDSNQIKFTTNILNILIIILEEIQNLENESENYNLEQTLFWHNNNLMNKSNINLLFDVIYRLFFIQNFGIQIRQNIFDEQKQQIFQEIMIKNQQAQNIQQFSENCIYKPNIWKQLNRRFNDDGIRQHRVLLLKLLFTLLKKQNSYFILYFISGKNQNCVQIIFCLLNLLINYDSQWENIYKITSNDKYKQLLQLFAAQILLIVFNYKVDLQFITNNVNVSPELEQVFNYFNQQNNLKIENDQQIQENEQLDSLNPVQVFSNVSIECLQSLCNEEHLETVLKGLLKLLFNEMDIKFSYIGFKDQNHFILEETLLLFTFLLENNCMAVNILNSDKRIFQDLTAALVYHMCSDQQQEYYYQQEYQQHFNTFTVILGLLNKLSVMKVMGDYLSEPLRRDYQIDNVPLLYGSYSDLLCSSILQLIINQMHQLILQQQEQKEQKQQKQQLQYNRHYEVNMLTIIQNVSGQIQGLQDQSLEKLIYLVEHYSQLDYLLGHLNSENLLKKCLEILNNQLVYQSQHCLQLFKQIIKHQALFRNLSQLSINTQQITIYLQNQQQLLDNYQLEDSQLAQDNYQIDGNQQQLVDKILVEFQKLKDQLPLNNILQLIDLGEQHLRAHSNTYNYELLYSDIFQRIIISLSFYKQPISVQALQQVSFDNHYIQNLLENKIKDKQVIRLLNRIQ